MIERLIPKIIKEKIKKYIRSEVALKYHRGYRNPSGVYSSQVILASTVFLYHPENITIADHVHINHYTYLDGSAKLEIGEGTQIGGWVGIYTHSSHLAIRLEGEEYFKISEEDKKAYFLEPVKIGKYVFIGNGTLILPGVTIGEGSFIQPRSFVMTDIPPRSIVKGHPAKIIGTVNNIDKRYLNKYPELKESYYDQEFVAHHTK